jgi:hypothetical protein
MNSQSTKSDRKENLGGVAKLDQKAQLLADKQKKSKEVEGLLIFAMRDGKFIEREDVLKEFRRKRSEYHDQVGKSVV